ncbi:hypothetical protein J6590_050352 [Homalodisca vitripennis]|nr:hypothetical protein J6590_050352 [Homalodisca vitripennis]
MSSVRNELCRSKLHYTVRTTQQMQCINTADFSLFPEIGSELAGRPVQDPRCAVTMVIDNSSLSTQFVALDLCLIRTNMSWRICSLTARTALGLIYLTLVSSGPSDAAIAASCGAASTQEWVCCYLVTLKTAYLILVLVLQLTVVPLLYSYPREWRKKMCCS